MNTTSAMTNKRILISAFGGPERMAVTTEQLRDPALGEARIRVLAAGVSWADCMMRRGTYPAQPKLPFTPGYDIVGVVDRSGAGTTRIAEGQVVAALIVHGGYSEFVFRPESDLVPVPAGIDPAEAVCLVLNYVTAYQMLHRVARVKAGDKILVHSAAGGVGTAAIELGKLAGLQMFGTASTGKLDFVSRLGCEAIDYRKTDFVKEVRSRTGDGVDAVFDSVGGTHWLRSSRCLKPGGVLIPFGSQNALKGGTVRKLEDVVSAAFLALRPRRRISLYSISGMKKKHPEWFREDPSILLQMLSEKRIKPIVAERLPWTEAAEAHRRLESGQLQGKIVLGFP
jgi:NADPH2:quinone reductase